MEFVWLLILIALAQFIFFTGKVGAARGKFDVPAPKTVGNEEWERLFRVQQNTMEQLILFVPGMIAFATYVSETWALLPGAAFVIGRLLYGMTYAKDPEKRAPGAVMSIFSNIILVAGGLIGVVLSLI